jgi:hypothetical protein
MKNTFPKIIKTREEMISLLPKQIKIAELGVFKGDFSRILFETINPKSLYLVDVFSGVIGSGDKNGENFEFINLSESFNFLQNYFAPNPQVNIVRSYSHDFLNSLEDQYLDAVYIDADHSYEAVKNDLSLSIKKVKSGGFIMGHDYHKNIFPSVVQAVDEFCKENSLFIKYLTEDGCPSFLIENI